MPNLSGCDYIVSQRLELGSSLVLGCCPESFRGWSFCYLTLHSPSSLAPSGRISGRNTTTLNFLLFTHDCNIITPHG